MLNSHMSYPLPCCRIWVIVMDIWNFIDENTGSLSFFCGCSTKINDWALGLGLRIQKYVNTAIIHILGRNLLHSHAPASR
jgi:hypothetical protein